MKAFLLATTVVFSSPVLAAEYNIGLAQERYDENSLTCFEGINHDESLASEAQIKGACEAIAELAAELKANNICKTADDKIVKCPK